MKKNKIFLLGLVIGTIVTSVIPVMADSVRQAIEVTFNSVNLQVNGQKIKVDNFLYNGTTYVPLRAVAEALDKDVDWINETKTVNIIDKTLEENNNNETSEIPVDKQRQGDEFFDVDEEKYMEFKKQFTFTDYKEDSNKYEGNWSYIKGILTEKITKEEYENFDIIHADDVDYYINLFKEFEKGSDGPFRVYIDATFIDPNDGLEYAGYIAIIKREDNGKIVFSGGIMTNAFDKKYKGIDAY